MRCLRMTGRTGLRHQDSRGTDTWHTSESRWGARRLQSGTRRLSWPRMSALHLTDDPHLFCVRETPWAVASSRRHRQPPGLSSLVVQYSICRYPLMGTATLCTPLTISGATASEPYTSYATTRRGTAGISSTSDGAPEALIM